ISENGSGKSAILTALVVGLGGKASTTSRAASLKDFIKKGMNSATVEVTLNNSGIYSYKPDKYGDSIIISRNLTSANSSSYKIKSEKGTVVCTGKEELENIISALNIQVDNPVSVLNQDSARTFLNSSDPREKYALFMKATQIEKLYASYNVSLEDKRIATNIVNAKKESLGVAEKEVKDLEHTWTTLKSLEKIREKKIKLEDELYWAVVVSEENKMKVLQETLNGHVIKLPQIQLNLNAETECEQELKNSIKNIRDRILEKRSVITTHEKQCSELKNESLRRKESYLNKQRQYKSLAARTQRMADNVATLKQAIDNFKSDYSSEQASKRAKIQQEITELEKRKKDVEQTTKTRSQFYNQLRTNVEKLMSDQSSLLQEKLDYNHRIEQKKRELHNMKEQSGDSLTVFGTWAPRVAQKIDEAFRRGLFEKKPRGPLGAYVKLKDATWAPAVEGFLESLTRSYCVSSSKDSQVLSKIFNEVLGSQRKPTIISGKFIEKLHDVERFALKSREYSNILDMLIISDPVVANVLIDQKEIEAIMLIPTSEEASRIMCNANLVPRNCKRAITKRGDQFYPDPNYRTYAGDGNSKAKFLQISMEEAISAAEEELKNLVLQREEIEKQLKTVGQHLTENRNETKAACESLSKIKQEGSRINLKLSELRDIEEPEPISVVSLTAELKESEDVYEKVKAEERSMEAECQAVKNDFEENEKNFKELKEKYKELQREEIDLVNEKANIQRELKEILLKKSNWDKKYKEMCKVVASSEANLKKQQDVVNNAIAAAEQVCPARIDTDSQTFYLNTIIIIIIMLTVCRSPQEIQKEVNDCNSYVASVEQETGSLEQVGEEFIKKKTKFCEIAEDLKVLEDSLQKLEVMIKDRLRKIITIERLTSIRVQHMFQSLMHSRKYKGKLEIDHAKQSLEIQVCPGNTNERGMSDTKSLSGGERSYATVSFLMSLWDTVEPPFYFLDEFDVFMDKINRHIIMDLLLEHARQKTTFQFVFLTPQDASHIQSSADLKIHRMEDPERAGTH
ncbi:hypothetical protein L9F63_019657, partial [Diploptera punctata]